MEGSSEVRYVRCGGVNIAYTRFGRGSHVVVYTPPLASNCELFWESPNWARSARRSGEYVQLVLIDKRGVGLSDRVTEAPTLEDRVADTLAVMDAEGIETADLVGQSEGAMIAVALAAMHPERVRSTVLVSSYMAGVPREELTVLADEDWPYPPQQQLEDTLRALVRHWASEDSINLELMAPSAATDPATRRWYQRYERQSASPAAVLGFLRSVAAIDIRPYLERVTAPTLVVHARRDRICHVAHGRYLAAAIADARYIEYDTDDHVWQMGSDWRPIEDDILEFITGHRPAPAPQTAFAAVLFTDIVDSTARETTVGDTSWRRLLENHDRLAHDLITRRDGRIVKHTGDGLVAIFSDPAAALATSRDFAEQLHAMGLPIRAGLHAGVIEILDNGDITGITVNIAARVQAKAGPNEVFVSDTLRDLLLGTDVTFEDRGEHDLKGLDRPRRLFAAVTGNDAASL